MSTKLRGQLLAAMALAFGVAFVLTPSAAYAQTSGATDVTIALPKMVVLHYFSTVDVTIDVDSLEGHLAYTDGDTVDEGDGTASTTSLAADLAIAPDAPTGDITAVNLEMSNAWAVRALGGAGDSIRISIANTEGSLTNAGGGSLTVTGVGVQVGGGGYSTQQDFAPPGLGSTQKGDVRLTLNLSSATRSGDYVGGTYTLTVTSL